MTTSAFFAAAIGFRRRSVVDLRPDQFRMRLAVPGSVGDFERDLAALFEVDAAHARCESSRAAAERRCYLLAVHRKPAESLAANAEQKVA